MSGRKKYSDIQRLDAVLKVINEHFSSYAVADELGTVHSVIQRWVARYEQFGIEGLIMKHGSYTGDFKINVIQYMHENHLSIAQTAARFGIPNDSTVSKWERIFYEEGPQALSRDNRGRKIKMSSNKKTKKIDSQTEEDLIAEVQHLRMENEYLKKLNALVQERIARENGKKPPSSTN